MVVARFFSAVGGKETLILTKKKSVLHQPSHIGVPQYKNPQALLKILLLVFSFPNEPLAIPL